MKERKTMLLVIILVFSLLWLTLKYINLTSKYNGQQENIDNTFKSSLRNAISGFTVDLNSTSNSTSNEGSALYMYNESMSNLASATKLAELTTYERKNDSLDVALNSLYRLMEQEDIYKKSIIEKSIQIHDILVRLSYNPTDKEATDNISKLAEEIRQENK
jgi:uncharacterized protein YqhQ